MISQSGNSSGYGSVESRVNSLASQIKANQLSSSVEREVCIEEEQIFQMQEKEDIEFEQLLSKYLLDFPPAIVSNLEDAKEAWEAKSGHLWDCYGRRPSRFGGYVYLFEGKAEYDNAISRPDQVAYTIAKKDSEIFPAIENDAMQLLYSLNLDLERGNIRDLKSLGYSASVENGKVLMELPDRDSLMGAWQALRTIYPKRDLPILDIVSSEGIADDLSYTEAYFKHNVILSTGIEFCHDHHYHVIMQLTHMLKGSSVYAPEKARLDGLIFSVYRTIHIAKQVGSENVEKHWNVLCFISGMLTDRIFSRPPESVKRISKEFVESAIVDEIPMGGGLGWNSYIQRRFPGLGRKEIGAVWAEAKQVEKDYLSSRNLEISARSLLKKQSP